MKIAVVGLGAVGGQTASVLLNSNYCKELMLIDNRKEMENAQYKDLMDEAIISSSQTKIIESKPSLLVDYDFVVITASVAVDKVASRLDSFELNSKIINEIISDIELCGFNGKYVIASNPVDLMCSVAADLLGDFNRVIGTGTILDSARFERVIADEIGVNPRMIEAMVIGEHGDSSVPLYSKAVIGSSWLTNYLSNNNIAFDFQKVTDTMRKDGYSIFGTKGNTSFGIAAAIGKIIRAHTLNTEEVLPITVYSNRVYGTASVFIPLPCKIENGEVVFTEININEHEKMQLSASSKVLAQFITI